MKTNIKTLAPVKYTAEGAIAARTTAEQDLRRSVMSCLLWEDAFYEEGEAIAERIVRLVSLVPAETVRDIAIEARERMKLRHVPLLLTVTMAGLKTHRHVVAETAERVIQRADELSEILSLYAKIQKRTGLKKLNKLSKQLQKGVASAFLKFNEYALAKYNQDNDIKLKDVLFLTHPTPQNPEQDLLFKKLIAGTLETPDTWEVELSKSSDKKASWERLLIEKKLGALALIRNLRNMSQASVNTSLIHQALSNVNVERVLPFRFVSAAQHAPQFEPALEDAMLRCLGDLQKLPGRTLLIVDVSGSMGSRLSAKSELDRCDAAASVAMLVREVCEDAAVYATAGSDSRRTHTTALIPARRGFALRDAIRNAKTKLGGGGIFLKQVMDYVYNLEKDNNVQRVIVLTDEQDCDIDPAKAPSKANTFGVNNYLINIAAERNGIGYGKWIHIDGWSEAVLQYIAAYEGSQN